MAIPKLSQTIFLPNYIGNIQAWAVDTTQQVSEALNQHATVINLIAATGSPVGANPTATASNVAVNGTALTFMRSDAAPPVQLATASVFGLVKPDGTTITISGGVISSSGGATGANPTATGGPSAINGSATTFMRSDAAPAIQIGTSSQKGLLQVDGTTITVSSGVITAVQPVGANPTATAGPAAINGVATTFMRSDGAPAIQKASASQFGIVEVDNTTITAAAGVISAVGPVSSVSNSDSTLTISPTTGAVVASLNLAHANTWTAAQTFSPSAANTTPITISGGSITGSSAVVPGISITGTLNTTGVVGGAAIFANITNTATGADSRIVDIQVGGASLFALGTSSSSIQIGPHVTSLPSNVTFASWGVGLAITGVNITNTPSVRLVVGNIAEFQVSSTGVQLPAVGGGDFYGWGGSTTSIIAPATNTYQLSGVDSDPARAVTLQVNSVSSGNANVAGQNWTFKGSRSTGSGLSGDIIFQTGGTGAASTAQNAVVTGLTIKGATQQVQTSSSIADTGYSYQTPATGFSATLGNNTYTTIFDPAATLALGTVIMPASPTDGQMVQFSFSQIITGLTVSANTGQSIKDAPTTVAAGGGFRYIFRLANTTWYRLQ